MRGLLAVLLMVLLLSPCPARARDDRPPIVAVMTVETAGFHLKPAILERLTDFVSGQVAATGRFEVIPRDHVQERLVQMKKHSYPAIDQSCQIQLGQALAAEKALTTKVVKLGKTCTVSLGIFDLAREVIERGSTAEGRCDEEGIADSMTRALESLLRRDPTSGGTVEWPVTHGYAPRVQGDPVTAAWSDLTILAKTADGTPVRVEVTDPEGRTAATRSPFKDPRARTGTWRIVARAEGHQTEATSVEVPPDDAILVKLLLKPDDSSRKSPSPTTDRFPTIESQDEAHSGDEFAVQVSLTVKRTTPEVEVRRGARTADGAMAMDLPTPATPEGWTLDVFLSAPGLKVQGKANSQVVLPVDGDSTPALFQLKVAEDAPSASTLSATFFHRGRFLGQAVRTVRIVRTDARKVASGPVASSQGCAPAAGPAWDAAAASAVVAMSTGEASQAAPRAVATGPIANVASPQVPALSIWYEVGQAEAHAGRSWARVQVIGPVFASEDVPVPPDLDAWLGDRYSRLARFGRGIQVAPADASAERSARDREGRMDFIRGLGREIHDHLLPATVQRALAKLPPGATVQVMTNDPRIPWELAIRPEHRDPIGVEFTMARLHIRQSREAIRTPVVLAVARLAALAPGYNPPLLSQQAEIQALRRAAPGVLVEMDGLRPWLQSGRSILHFAGHGRLSGEGPEAHYVLMLADGELDLTEWRGMTADLSQTRPFVFLNACDLGQAARVAGFVDGWGPAVLEAGASGFVGGLFPLGDRAAADFATHFYEEALSGIPVGEAVRHAREAFRETGDPTYLGYVVYGDPDLVLRLDR